MVIDELHVRRPLGGPKEAYPKLTVYANGVLPGPIADERFQPIPGRVAQLLETSGLVDRGELQSGSTPQVSGKTLAGIIASHQAGATFVLEALNRHGLRLAPSLTAGRASVGRQAGGDDDG